MRVVSLSLDFGLILVGLVVLLRTQGTNGNSDEHIQRDKDCPSDNCLPAEQCEMQATVGSCMNSENVCCSIVKGEFRTLCRHWGGDCMDYCNPTLAQSTIDCPANQQCCVLV